jgi:hypothetical protein
VYCHVHWYMISYTLTRHVAHLSMQLPCALALINNRKHASTSDRPLGADGGGGGNDDGDGGGGDCARGGGGGGGDKCLIGAAIGGAGAHTNFNCNVNISCWTLA